MVRFAVLALLIGACSNGSKQPGDQPKAAEGAGSGEEKVAVPTEGTKGAAEGGADRGGPVTGAAAPANDPCQLTPATKQRAQNPAFQLKPEEGTLTVGKAEGKPGAAATAEIKLAPGSGYKVANDYPVKLLLEQPTGVKLDKACMTAGGRNKSQGDAAKLSEKELAFAIKATPEAAGAYEIQGVFSFGVCDPEACHPRTQPITIQVAAK